MIIVSIPVTNLSSIERSFSKPIAVITITIVKTKLQCSVG